MIKSIRDMTDEEISKLKTSSELEAEYIEKFNPQVGDCILTYDSIRHQKFLVIIEEQISMDNSLLPIHTSYGHSIMGVLSIEKNYGNIGTLDEVAEKYPEYFI